MSSPAKLFSCVQHTAILKSPINTSPSKHQWSFSKGERFKNSKKQYCDTFYNLPHTKSQRKAGFGIGKKIDLDIRKDHNHVVPPPTSYNIQSFVDINVSHKKGFTPRFSREDIAPMSYIDVQQKRVPGPGRYEQFRINQSPRWSFRPRGNSQMLVKSSQKSIPGPGAHENKEVIDPIGNYYLSNHPSSKSKLFNPPHSTRFYNKSTDDLPGPGQYKNLNEFPADGNYVLSGNKSSRKRAFLLGRRPSFVEDLARRVQTPGPGTYRAPSDFGQYDEIMQKGDESLKATQKTQAGK